MFSASAAASGWRFRYEIFQNNVVTQAVVLDSADTTGILAVFAALAALVIYGTIGLVNTF